MNTLNTDLFIRPLESLFFGAPKPFNAGESHHARSEFPPSPMTMQGIIRSQLLRAATPPLDLDDWSPAARKERADLVGDSDRLPQGWQLKGPLPATIQKNAQGETSLYPWAPAPRFLYRVSDRQQRIVHGEIFPTDHPACNDLTSDPSGAATGALLFGPSPEWQGARPLTGWVDSQTLLQVLSGNRTPLPAEAALALPHFVRNDQRQPGIALDRKSNTGQDGMLYLLEHLRFRPESGLWANFSGSLAERIGQDALQRGIGAAGRKGRLVAMEEPPPLATAWRDLLSGRHLGGDAGGSLFWLYLLTPARLDGETGSGGLPPFGRVRLRWEIIPTGVTVRCRAALTGPPITLGGMDTARGRSRPNYTYLPPGSAWLLEIIANDAALVRETLENLNNTHPLGDPEEARFGFGHTLVGIGPNAQGEKYL